jgi:hypothetical protein
MPVKRNGTLGDQEPPEQEGGVGEPRKRAHSPQVLPDGSASQAAGSASVSENGKLPYGRRSPAACCRVFNGLGATGRGRKVNKISSIFIGLNGGSVLSLAINHRFLWK